MIKVGIVGASGYTGLELCRLLLAHDQVQITHIFSTQYQGQPLGDLYPQLKTQLTISFESEKAFFTIVWLRDSWAEGQVII